MFGAWGTRSPLNGAIVLVLSIQLRDEGGCADRGGGTVASQPPSGLGKSCLFVR